MIKTVGELKEFLKEFPDDMTIVKFVNGMEYRGYEEGIFPPTTANMSMVKKRCVDAFDYTAYTVELFVSTNEDDEGSRLVLKL